MAIADVTNKSVAEIVSLANRRAVVTGGAQGLGKAIARRLAQAGADVLIGDLQDGTAKTVAAELSQEFGVRVLSTQLDVTDAGSVARAADFAAAQLGGIDIWVNNAGIYPNIRIFDMSVEVWDKVMDINLRGVFLGAREAARHMVAAAQNGVIINIVSTAGFRGLAPGISAYVASKHGVRGLTRQMALELAPQGIRVLGVAPTFCVTEGNTAALAENPNPDVAKEIGSIMSSPLGRVGVPDDIGRVVLFCASDMSLFMTGSTLLVDAGEMA